MGCFSILVNVECVFTANLSTTLSPNTYFSTIYHSPSVFDVFLQETNQQTDCEIIKIIVVFVHNIAEIKKSHTGTAKVQDDKGA